LLQYLKGNGERKMIKFMPSTYRTAILFVLAGCLSLVSAYQSKADSTTLQLSSCNVASLCNAGTIGLATSGSGTSEVIVVTVTLNSGFGLFGNGQGNGAIGWNGTSLLGTSNVPSGFSASGGGTFDGFGSFAFSLDGPTAANAVSSLTFDITCVNGCTSVSQVTSFAVHVINNNLSPAATGFDSTTGTGVVPEPVSMLLFGTGLVAIGAKLRRRKSRNQITV
jgi:hypothetical protein